MALSIYQSVKLFQGFRFQTETLPEKLIREFCDEMFEAIRELDLLGSWVKGEFWFKDELAHAKLCRLDDLEPFRFEVPWTRALEGKRVLVVHPFEQTIVRQYRERRHGLFSDPQVLPKFDLVTVRAVQSIAGERPKGFQTWFEALDAMEEQAIAKNAQVAIIGCGAYGFPLAARMKRHGMQCIHMGGATQLLFGIKGNRWDVPSHPVSALFNENWVRPLPEERPQRAHMIENACYW